MKRLQTKRLKYFNGFVVQNENGNDDDDNEIELKDKNDDTISAYTSYMTEVISAFVFYANPGVNLEQVLPNIKESATKIVKITKFLIEVIAIN